MTKFCRLCHKKKPLFARGWGVFPDYTCPECLRTQLLQAYTEAADMRPAFEREERIKKGTLRFFLRFLHHTFTILGVGLYADTHHAHVGMTTIYSIRQEFADGSQELTGRYTDEQREFVNDAMSPLEGEGPLTISPSAYPRIIGNIRKYARRIGVIIGYCNSCGTPYNLAIEICPKCGAAAATSGVRL